MNYLMIFRHSDAVQTRTFRTKEEVNDFLQPEMVGGINFRGVLIADDLDFEYFPPNTAFLLEVKVITPTVKLSI